MFKDMPNDFKIEKVIKDAKQVKIPTAHVHPFHEIFYLANGECNVTVNNKIYKFVKGDIVIVPAGEIHKTIYTGSGPHERIIISFREDVINWIKEFAGEAVVDECFTTQVVSIPEKRRDYVEGLMNKLLFESGFQDLLSPAFVRTSLVELILFIIRCQKYVANAVKEIDIDNQLMQGIATYIYKNYNKNLTLNYIAAKFHISRSYLSKKFKATTGFGFKEYIVNVRIKNACTLLLETNKSITDIAFECGFNDSNYFGDAFRNIKGISPNKYRKNKETI